MFIRRKRKKSGTFSVQVIDKRGGTNVVLRSFGGPMTSTSLNGWSTKRELVQQISVEHTRGIIGGHSHGTGLGVLPAQKP